MNFLGMGPFELVVIFGLALVVFGPGKLPELARQVGQVMGEFRRITSEAKGELKRSLQAEELQSVRTELKQSLQVDPVASQPTSPSPQTSADPSANPQPFTSPSASPQPTSSNGASPPLASRRAALDDEALRPPY
jgi:sec-independent protein translocase protein TatB